MGEALTQLKISPAMYCGTMYYGTMDTFYTFPGAGMSRNCVWVLAIPRCSTAHGCAGLAVP